LRGDFSRAFADHRMFPDTEQFWFFGTFAGLCVLCASLSLIDIQRGIIPNELNLLIAVLGLIKIVIGGAPSDAVATFCQAAAIGAIFWVLRRLYFSWRKAQGLGLGDVKFLAAAGTWIGIAGLPILLLIATSLALAAAGGLQLAGHEMNRQTSLPFGPFLACGLVMTVLLQRFLGL
jgi:leader peptidase (prepilin peptidase) / N-methyltransferase